VDENENEKICSRSTVFIMLSQMSAQKNVLFVIHEVGLLRLSNKNGAICCVNDNFFAYIYFHAHFKRTKIPSCNKFIFLSSEFKIIIKKSHFLLLISFSFYILLAELFKTLLQQSKEGFHQMFKQTYGVIYEQNSYVFSDLFVTLEGYFLRGKLDLTEMMDRFFNQLYQKMFTVINRQYEFNDE
jgi:hypothetical protein